jgi:hypothetical protein
VSLAVDWVEFWFSNLWDFLILSKQHKAVHEKRPQSLDSFQHDRMFGSGVYDKSRIIGNCRRLKTNGRFVSQGAKSTLGIKTIYPRLHSEMISAVMKFR